MLQILLTIYFLPFISLNSVHGFLGSQCNIHDLRSRQCEQFETCDESSNSCQCLPGYVKIDTSCENIDESSNSGLNVASQPNSSSLVNDNASGGSAVAGFMLLFVFLLTLVGGIFLSRRYNLVQWMRSKVYSFRQSHYDEFMIGHDVDDDPPLR